MKKRLLRLNLLFMFIVVFLFTACQKVNQDNLSGTTWILTELNGSKPIEGTRLTAAFEAGQISGQSGCNQYGGEYKIDSEKINFDSLYNTEMACQNPEGVMEQEQVYLGILRNAVRFSQDDTNLVIYDEAGANLIYESYDPNSAVIERDDSTATVQVQAPTAVVEEDTPSPEIPSWEHHTYKDPATGMSILIPKSWIVTGVIEGEYAILQSYPEDKYIGGEPREEGDTKCDLNIRPEGSTIDALIDQWQSSTMTTILSEEPFALANGGEGLRFEIDSLGRSIAFLAMLDGRVVLLTCFGNFEMVDEIAMTLDIGE